MGHDHIPDLCERDTAHTVGIVLAAAMVGGIGGIVAAEGSPVSVAIGVLFVVVSTDVVQKRLCETNRLTCLHCWRFDRRYTSDSVDPIEWIGTRLKPYATPLTMIAVGIAWVVF